MDSGVKAEINNLKRKQDKILLPRKQQLDLCTISCRAAQDDMDLMSQQIDWIADIWQAVGYSYFWLLSYYSSNLAGNAYDGIPGAAPASRRSGCSHHYGMPR